MCILTELHGSLLNNMANNQNSKTAKPAVNGGQVKLNTGNGLKPTITMVGGGGGNLNVFQSIAYASPLAFSASPTTTYPGNIVTPTSADFYASGTNTFLENTVLGQTHLWRVIVNYSGKTSGAKVSVYLRIRNTLSSFVTVDSKEAPNGATSGVLTFILLSIADGASLPSPFGTGQGYVMEITAGDPITLEVDSVVRESSAYTNRS